MLTGITLFRLVTAALLPVLVTVGFYLAEKNPRTHPEKLVMKKYDKKSKKHEEFVEKKLK